jgi:ADP-heptose:LPS heptosyltransferase
MENILIINLDETSSLFSMGRLVKGLSIKNPESKIGLLVLEEELNAAGLIPGVDEIFPIKTSEIQEYLKSELFSDALAINSFMETIAKVEEKNWDNIVNFGNDEVGKYLSSYFSLKYPDAKFTGVKFSEENNPIPVGKWHILANVLKEYSYYPLNDLEIVHLSSKAPISLSSRPSNEKKDDIKVGIQIPRRTDDKNLPFKTLIELIDTLKTDLNYFPILLFDPRDSNDEYAGKINRYFDNELEIISTNYLNLTKIIPLLDTLITSSKSLKNLAQQIGIPVIEAIGEKDHLDSTWAPGKKDLTVLGKDRLRGEDLYNVLTRQFKLLDPEVKLFASLKDSLGAWAYQLHGYREPARDIAVLMSRYLIGKIYLNISETEIFEEILENFGKELAEWQDREKEVLCEVSRIILNSLRLIKQITENPDKVKEFVESIDGLLKYAKTGNLVSIPLLNFKYQTELISTETDLYLFERIIFDLKEGVQTTMLALKDIENAVWNKKKKSIVEKSIKNRPVNLT